ncbi:Dabb family protein [Salipiger sp. IMCC34102]|uniref:Dabb family protein n=1 Tax=Salipiger sp. IMCC34102 TaxID=2510647 RepID=UPI00101DCC43|nr:Dabb family protein [Salipiger sp. IMCC34102]RYH03885.1 Dabb family protein [Salipiger sp. IMCC34102]
MIDHIVLCRLDPDHDPQALQAVMAGLAGLVGTLPGFLSFAHGPNLDLEARSPGFGYGFRATFADRDALGAYAADPEHQRLGAALVDLCADGINGLFIADLDHVA